MDLAVDDLFIEVTRRCNMQCPHCLRGEAENLEISEKNVDRLFSKISRIGTLTITGGEPSLVPEKIEMIVRLAKRNGVSIGNFSCVTNAKQVTDYFILAILQLYLYCDDNECSGLAYSSDMFHDGISDENIKKLKAFSFTSDKGEIDEQHLIMEGRAAMNYDTDRYLRPYKFSLQDDWVADNDLYLNCKGNLVADCNCSYETQDYSEFLIGNVMEIDDLREAIERYNEKIGRVPA
jgi:hypothetical protein